MIKLKAILAMILALILVQALPSVVLSADSINLNAILAEANLKNGQAIYDTGRRETGAYLSFNGGPNWLHVDGGGCATCHGPTGLGEIVPDFCSSKTPPITHKYLAGNGYPFSSRQNRSHPAYTMQSFKEMMRTGLKANGYDADFCMPRWHISNDELRDLMGYLITLGK